MADLIYMAKTKWTALLDSIRTKGGTSALMTADQAKAAVDAIPTGGGGEWTSDGIAAGTEPSGNITVNSTVIAQDAFASKPITGVSAPNATSLGRTAFSRCASLKTASFDSLVAIGNGTAGNNTGAYAFQECRALEKAIFPSLETIGTGDKYMFFNVGTTSSYKAVIVMPKVKSLGKRTFDRCYVDKVDIGPGVTAFTGADLFYCNTDTKTVNVLILRYAGGVVTTSNTDRIKGLRDVYVPSALISQYEQATNWSTRVAAGKITFHAIEGSIYETKYADGTPIE